MKNRKLYFQGLEDNDPNAIWVVSDIEITDDLQIKRYIEITRNGKTRRYYNCNDHRIIRLACKMSTHYRFDIIRMEYRWLSTEK